MLRSAEVDALLNQTVLVPQSVWSKNSMRKQSEETRVSSQPHYCCSMIFTLAGNNHPLHLRLKDGSAASKAAPLILTLNRFYRSVHGEQNFHKAQLWLNNYDKGQVHQGTLKNTSFPIFPGADLVTPTLL